VKEIKPKILLWDIEASNLDADFGFIFCIAYKWLGSSKVNLISIRQFDRFKRDVTDDVALIKKFLPYIEDADLQVAWYGSRFDLPFLNARCMMNKIDPPANTPMYDPWRTARYKLKLSSNRLANLSQLIPLPENGVRELKTPLDFKHWTRGRAGYADALKYIESHCVADIRVLEKVYLEMRKYGTALPNMSKIGNERREGCPACGSGQIQSRGTRATARGRQGRYQCVSCAAWFSLPIKIKVSSSV